MAYLQCRKAYDVLLNESVSYMNIHKHKVFHPQNLYYSSYKQFAKMAYYSTKCKHTYIYIYIYIYIWES